MDGLGGTIGTTRRAVLGGIATGGALALTGCGSSTTASYRFRMTVEVQTPAGVKTGSTVMEESAYRYRFQTSESGAGRGVLRGEAVFVDLPDGLLFALLKLPDAKGSLDVFLTQALAGGRQLTGFEDYFAAIRKLSGWFSSAKAELPRDDWPMMVRFRDINDPKSVEQVDPATVGVKRILLETTRDEITTGIEKRLPWLGSDPLTLGKGGSMGPPMAGGYLSNNAFRSETAR